jgi:predicted phosphoribosyltransferase
MIFQNRQDAGRQLAERLARHQGEKNLLVLGIPRGGVVVAAEIARALNAPLDVFLAHKIGAPENPEFAIGAVTSTGEVWLDDETIDNLKINRAEITREVEQECAEMARRASLYRGTRAPLEVKDNIVVVADDGIATGSTMLAAMRALRRLQPARLIAAIPVGPGETIAALRDECDEVIVLATPVPFWAVGRFYTQFDQTQDDQVIRLLRAAEEKFADALARR